VMMRKSKTQKGHFSIKMEMTALQHRPIATWKESIILLMKKV